MALDRANGKDLLLVSRCRTHVLRRLRGGEDIRVRSRALETVYRSLYANTLSIYEGLYGGFGSARFMVLKTTWDYCYYWSLLALLFTPITALGAVVTPAMQGILSKLTPDDSQGELQGVLSSISAVAMILSPLVMTSVFARFASEGAAYYLPGAPFLVSMILMLACLVVFLPASRREPA